MKNTDDCVGQDIQSGSLEKVAMTTDLVHFGYRRVPDKEKGELVHRHFNSVAPKYDCMNTLLSFGLHYLWKWSAVRMLRPDPGERIVDVCGGTADLAVLAARAVGTKGKVVLYDINRSMMEIGRSKVAKSPLGRRIQFIQGNAETIALPDEHFDAAMVGFGIRNLTYMERGLQEMYRILRRGGRLMCLEFSQPTTPFFRWLYEVYSIHVMPLAGQLLAGSRQAYTYLPESIRVFPLPDEFTAVLLDVGFSKVTYRKLTNGIAVVHLGMKR